MEPAVLLVDTRTVDAVRDHFSDVLDARLVAPGVVYESELDQSRIQGRDDYAACVERWATDSLELLPDLETEVVRCTLSGATSIIFVPSIQYFKLPPVA